MHYIDHITERLLLLESRELPKRVEEDIRISDHRNGLDNSQRGLHQDGLNIDQRGSHQDGLHMSQWGLLQNNVEIPEDQVITLTWGELRSMLATRW